MLADRSDDYIEAQRSIRTAFQAVSRLPHGTDEAGAQLADVQVKLAQASEGLREWYEGPPPPDPSWPPHPGA